MCEFLSCFNIQAHRGVITGACALDDARRVERCVCTITWSDAKMICLQHVCGRDFYRILYSSIILLHHSIEEIQTDIGIIHAQSSKTAVDIN